MKHIKPSLFLSSLFFISNIAYAGTTTWEWDLKASFGNSQEGDSTFSVDGTNSENSDTLGADLAAFADTYGSGDNSLAYGGFKEFSGGLGIVNADEDGDDNQHAFDNMGSYISNGEQQSSSTADYDMALISFDTSVELTGIDFGWVSDGDFTLLAYTGSGPFGGSNLDGSTWATQANSGNWLTVGQYAGSGAGYYSVNNSGTSSQYWLLGAYNSVFGDSQSNHIVEGNDAFKVRKLAGNTTTNVEQVSSPAAFSLLLVGLSGIYFRRNKKC